MMARPPRHALNNAPTSVYRYYDRHDVLVYVGITGRGTARNFEHDRAAAWWKYVARQEVDHFPTRHEAEAREKELIRQFRPPFNTKHNPDAKVMRATYLHWVDLLEPDPFVLHAQIGNALPLKPFGPLLPHRLILRTAPEHFAVASRLVMVDRVTLGGSPRVGTLTSIERSGFVTLLHFTCKNMRPVLDAVASIKYIENPSTLGKTGRPPEFRLRGIQYRVIRPAEQVADEEEHAASSRLPSFRRVTLAGGG